MVGFDERKIFSQSRLQIHQNRKISVAGILHLGALFVELVRVARAFAVVCHYSGSHLAAIAARCWAI
jgi:hypothetical protein